MYVHYPTLDKFSKFFKAHKKLMTARDAMNKATNELMGKKFYSNETKKTWRVINAYEKGHFLSRSYTVWIEDISTELKFWTWERLKYGWKHPRMMLPISVLEEKFEQGILKVIEFEWEDKLKDKDYGKED